MSFFRSHTIFRWLLASSLVSLTAGVVAIGCSGDDTNPGTGSGSDASFVDTGDFVDVKIVVNDSGKINDSGSNDASDAAVLCANAPDAAAYGLDSIDAGSMTVTARGCKGCHTADLSGNASTPVGGQYPKNLTPDRATGLGCWTDDEIARAVLVGIDDQGQQLCVMPQFAASIGDAGITDVIAFLRSLPPVSKVVPESTCGLDAGADADAN